MQNYELILLCIAAFIGALIIWRVAKYAMRFLIIGVIALLIYIFVFNGDTSFILNSSLKPLIKDKNLIELHDAHCSGAKRTKLKCACIVQPVYEDMNNRFSARELQAMTREKQQDEMITSFNNTSSIRKACINEKKDNSLSFIDKVKNFIAMFTNDNKTETIK